MAAATRVLVVDDSLTMRALISGALERIPGVEVVGMADGAAEARELVATLHPHVMTLDVEMPGMSGIDYLAEIMETRPLPVIMFSTRTTAGAADSIEALRLGAIDCFPKPRVAAPKELDAIIARLGKRLKAARNAELRGPRSAAPAPRHPPINWNGRVLVVGADASNTAALFELFSGFPANCPPTLVVQHLGAGLAASMVEQLQAQVAAKVVLAQDGMAAEQGHIYVAGDPDAHLVLDAWPNGKLRHLARDPVAGERPSISLLFASAARAAGANAVGLLLVPDASEDGGGGLKALVGAGSYALSPAGKEAGGAGGFTLARNMAQQPVAADQILAQLMKLANK